MRVGSRFALRQCRLTYPGVRVVHQKHFAGEARNPLNLLIKKPVKRSGQVCSAGFFKVISVSKTVTSCP